jgi:prevent-host-death family protein
MTEASEIGVRELRNRLSAVLRRVAKGETITICDRHRPIAAIVALRSEAPDEGLRRLVEAGRVAWSGGKPKGSRSPGTVRGRPVSDAVAEDRR